MSLAENLPFTKVQASHLTGQTQIWAKPKPIYVNPQSSCFASGNPYTNRKSKHARRNLVYLLFFLLVMFLLTQK